MSAQIWSTNTLGGYLSAFNLSKELRQSVQPMTKFRQFCDVKNAANSGKNKGQTFTWDVVSDVVTRGTIVAETNTTPETNFTITQGTLTVNEYINSVPWSGLLETLGEIDIRAPVMKALRNDNVKTMDAAAFAQFNLTPLRVAGTSSTSITLSTGGTCTATNSQAFNNGHHKLIIDLMKERNIPAYEGDDYMALAWPSTLRTFKNNLESIMQYTDQGISNIRNGEIGRYENCRYVEQTNIPKGGAADSTTFNAATNTADPWNGGFSDWIFFLGEDTIAEGMVVPLEMRAKIPGDYGRSKGVAWYELTGFGLVQTAQAQARIVKWDSAV